MLRRAIPANALLLFDSLPTRVWCPCSFLPPAACADETAFHLFARATHGSGLKGGKSDKEAGRAHTGPLSEYERRLGNFRRSLATILEHNANPSK